MTELCGRTGRRCCCSSSKVKTMKAGGSKPNVGVTLCFIIGVMLIASVDGMATGDTTTPSEYVIDGLFVVDDVMFSNFQTWVSQDPALANTSSTDLYELTQKAVGEYVYLTVKQANGRLATLKNHLPYSVRLQVVDIIMDKNILGDVAPSILTGTLTSKVALDAFSDWVKNSGYAFKYDHVMLLTGRALSKPFELVKSEDEGIVQGRAYTGAMCDTTGKSSSVVVDIGGFQSSYFIAHELAHSLGSPHDGTKSSSDCDPADQYIMAQVAQVAQRTEMAWHFSPCSARAIGDLILNITAKDSLHNCLTDVMTPGTNYAPTSPLPAGQLFSAIDQCKMMYGRDSGVCWGPDYGNIDEICTKMYCSHLTGQGQGQDRTTCSEHFAAEGTSCGNKMWCKMGRCVKDAAAPATDDCPLGDNGGAVFQGVMTCEEQVRNIPSSCYDEHVQQQCCAACKAVRRESEACPYGDHDQYQCSSGSCASIFNDGTEYNRICCSTCHYDVIKPCVDSEEYQGYSCEVIARIGGCYNFNAAYHCCKSCSKLRRNVTGCEYGDQVNDCSLKIGQNKEKCKNDTALSQRCCASCNDPNSAPQLSMTSFSALMLMSYLVVLRSFLQPFW